MNGDLVMGKLEEESSSGLEAPDSGQFCNIMHAFWLRVSVAIVTALLSVVYYGRMVIHEVTVNMVWMLLSSSLLCVIALVSLLRQLYLDYLFSGVFNSPVVEEQLGKDTPW